MLEEQFLKSVVERQLMPKEQKCKGSFFLHSQMANKIQELPEM